MTGRRAAVGLSLLCALVFSAFAAQSASALGTTAFTCKPFVGVAGSKGFSDEHCEKAAEGISVKFVHEAFAGATGVVGTNEKTASETTKSTTAVLHTITVGLEVTIECKKVSSTGTLENKEIENAEKQKEMVAAGSAVTISYSECTVSKPLKAGVEICQVKEPIVAKANSTTVKQENVTFSPSGANFTEITLENKAPEVCTIKGTFPITGNAIGKPAGPATAPGATLVFTGEGSLKFGASAASLTATETIRMSGAGGNPISLTRT
jgi:hypothetical protein